MGTWLLSGSKLALGFGYQAWQKLAPRVKPTIANVVPHLADRLLPRDHQLDGLSSLRLLGCGGAAMSESSFRQWQQRGVTVIQGYGLTEAGPVVCSATPANALPGLVGDFVDGWEYEIRSNHQLRETGFDSSSGRLFVRGPYVMRGYLDDQQATQKRVDESGWLDTGDLVEQDKASGQIRVLGRADEVIVLSDGHKVNPRAIESVVQQVSKVRFAVVVPAGRRCDLWIDLEDDVEPTKVKKQIAGKLKGLAKWEQPSEINFFSTPLSAQDNELTHKGTIRREVIIKNRINR